jgi:hypothetical protein
LEVSV